MNKINWFFLKIIIATSVHCNAMTPDFNPTDNIVTAFSDDGANVANNSALFQKYKLQLAQQEILGALQVVQL